MKNLVIVESPAKARTIEGFLGSDYRVVSSFGHIRDLSKENMGIDVTRDFAPSYIISDGKESVVRDLRSSVSAADRVWLASDDDREGEAIAWHLSEVLGLDARTTRRIAFHEITKSAIEAAIANPRTIDMDLVNAQQARRILDRLVGFEVSPILWRLVKGGVSAGRVQSVAVRLVVEREREISRFESAKYYRVVGQFTDGSAIFRVQHPDRLESESQARSLIEYSRGASFTVSGVEVKPLVRNPSAPFTTSTLQQEASRKLGFAVGRTMRAAQRLYESGYITYMRTDSVNLSDQARVMLCSVVEERFGSEYVSPREYRTKSKGAQEAHEAIRPTDARRGSVTDLTEDAGKLYQLILKRSLASQMASARLEKTLVTIDGVNDSGDAVLAAGLDAPVRFLAEGEAIRFDGFLKLYMEGRDAEHDDDEEEEGLLPVLEVGQGVNYRRIEAQERYTPAPGRYTEASLVKRLEELGIGRPSTYAPTMSTIMDRGYVVLDTREGKQREVWRYVLEDDSFSEFTVSERYGSAKRRLFASDIGMVVTDFLIENFPQMMEYDFTARIEDELDRVAQGELGWTELMHAFYGPFHERVEYVMDHGNRVSGERVLGKDPKSGGEVVARIGRYGPLVQLSDPSDPGAKPRYASLRSGQLIESITLEEALDLFRLPRQVGQYEGESVVINEGRYGPYVLHKGVFCSLADDDDPLSCSLERAIELIEEKRAREAASLLRTFSEDADVAIRQGRWGPYIKCGRENYRLPKGYDWEGASYADIRGMIDEQAAERAEKGGSRGGSRTKGRSSGTSRSTGAKGTSRTKSVGAKGTGKSGTKGTGKSARATSKSATKKSSGSGSGSKS